MAAKVEHKKGGYDYEFVSPPSKSLECPVCLMILRDPHVISCCGYEFCQVCIGRVQRDGKPCPLCNEQNFSTMLQKKVVREVNALVIRCPQNEQGCDWEGELGQLQSHLNPGAGVLPSEGCAYVVVSCAYQCGEHLQRCLLQQHETRNCPKRPIGVQISDMMRKMEDIATENQVLRQELSVIKEAHKNEIEEIKCSHGDDLHKVKEAFQQELGSLKQIQQQEIAKLRHQMDKMKQTHQRIYDSLQADMALRTHTMPLPLPPFYTLMRNVDHYMEGDNFYDSSPFYSHPGGYKMNIVAYPNYSGVARSTHLSVGIAILRGEFDDQLKWPFNGEVIIQAYNRTQGKWSAELTVVLNTRVCGLDVVRKPTDSLSYACEALEFLSRSNLKSRYTHSTNVIRFRVTKVKICD